VFLFKKVTAALRQLAYDVPADYVDEYIRIGESTAIESLRKFVRAICEVLSHPGFKEQSRVHFIHAPRRQHI
jgi:hypothetical protein